MQRRFFLVGGSALLMTAAARSTYRTTFFVNFERNSARLMTTEAGGSLGTGPETLAALLDSVSRWEVERVTVEASTSMDEGSWETLAARRARVVREALVAGGLAPALIDEPVLIQDRYAVAPNQEFGRNVRITVHHRNQV